MSADKHLFIITSALKPSIGVISNEDRLQQTFDTLKNVRSKIPDAIIIFVDCSVVPVENNIFEEITKYSDFNIDMGQIQTNALQMSRMGLKSQAEICMLVDTLTTIKHHPEIQKLLPSIKRIHKLSARSTLLDSFDINHYTDEYRGKYIFKERIPSWMQKELTNQSGADHLLITRMFSLCTSLIDDYIETLGSIFDDVNKFNIDTEHAHFKNIDKDKLVEWKNLNFMGIMAGNGSIETY